MLGCKIEEMTEIIVKATQMILEAKSDKVLSSSNVTDLNF